MISDFRSDTVTRPTPEMRQAMARAEVGDDVFGDDPTVLKLEIKIAELLGKEASIFVPTGSMGNQLAIALQTRPGEEILVGDQSHIFHYEMAGPALHSGVQCHPVRSGASGRMDPEHLVGAIRPASPYLPRTSLLCLENTHNLAGGAVIPLAHMEECAAIARERGLAVHLDGARIWNAAGESGIPLSRYSSLADTVMVCLSKGLGAPIGSMLAGTGELIRRARKVRKAFGGGMRQVGILAAAGLVALEHRKKLRADHLLARKIAGELSEIPGLICEAQATETNIVLVDLAGDPPRARVWREKLEKMGVLVLDMGPRRIRIMTHRDVNSEDGKHLVDAFSKLS